MNKKIVLLVIAGAALIYCWAWQNRNNNAKIEALSRTIAQLEHNQSRQMAGMQTQLIGLAPTLDKMNDSYFEKSQDKAIFFHTNTLYLILLVGKQIQSQLQVAETERIAQNAQEYGYYTNQLASLLLCTALIQESQTNSESRIVESVTAETKRLASTLSVALQKQKESQTNSESRIVESVTAETKRLASTLSVALQKQKESQTNSESRIVESVNAETKRLASALSLALQKQKESQTNSESRIVENVNAETKRLASALSLALQKQKESQTNSESRIVDSVNAETKRLADALSVALQKQIMLATTDPAGVARQKQIAADVAQMKVEVEQLKAALLRLATKEVLAPAPPPPAWDGASPRSVK